MSIKHLAGIAVAALTVLVVPSGNAQSLEDLNIQFHGYATQGFLYTSQNNILTTNSTSGSPAWTEAVVNLSATPTPKLRVAVQARYSIIGTIGDAITLDYASADYKANDRFGVRFGKVKTPTGLFNETQDIDPSYMWSLLPQSVYPILSRNSFLSNLGGVFYGTAPFGTKLGKLQYRAWAGAIQMSPNDGYFIPLKDAGISLPNGTSQMIVGSALHWVTPLHGLTIGASDTRFAPASTTIIAGGTLTGKSSANSANNYYGFAHYEHSRLMLAAEYTRLPISTTGSFPGGLTIATRFDNRGWYGMATYKVTEKLSAGLYQGQLVNRQAALGPARFSKDWALSARYDFSQYLYAKAEQHFIDGTNIVYDTADNTGGLKPDTRLTILKIGVSF